MWGRIKLIKKAMVMAAGVGSRLDPLTQNVPKPLVSVVNIPVMDILLQKLKNYGINQVIANTHYLADDIQKRYSENSPVDIEFNSICEENLSGTAGGVKKCQFFFEDVDNFLVLSADGLHDAPLDKIIQSHIESGCIATMAIASIAHEEVYKYGVVVPSQDNKVLEFQEKPSVDEAKSNYINTGIYVFSKKIFDFIPENTMFDFAKNVFPALMEAGVDINVFKIDCYWSDIGTLSQYVQSNWDALLGRVKTHNNELNHKSDSYYTIGSNCNIDSSVRFKGNVIVGDNCTLGKGVTLENVILWNNTTVKDNVCLKNVVSSSNACIFESLQCDDTFKIVTNDIKQAALTV